MANKAQQTPSPSQEQPKPTTTPQEEQPKLQLLLTPEGIKALLQGEYNTRPVVQILEVQKVPDETRFVKLVISDGQYHSIAILGSHLAALFDKLVPKSVIRITDWLRNCIKNKRGIFINTLHVLDFNHEKFFGDAKPFPKETLGETYEDANDTDWQEFSKLNMIDLKDPKCSLRIAKLEYEYSDFKLIELRHAISHIIVYINAEPNNTDGYELLDKIIEHYKMESQSHDPLDLTPVDKEQNNSWDKLIARAYIQAEKNDNIEDAFWLLFNSQLFYAQVQLVSYWLPKWIKKYGVEKVCSADSFEQAMLLINSSFTNESNPNYEAEKKNFQNFYRS